MFWDTKEDVAAKVKVVVLSTKRVLHAAVQGALLRSWVRTVSLMSHLLDDDQVELSILIHLEASETCSDNLESVLMLAAHVFFWLTGSRVEWCDEEIEAPWWLDEKARTWNKSAYSAKVLEVFQNLLHNKSFSQKIDNVVV